MPDFLETFDTSGHVSTPSGVSLEWRELSCFVQGYIQALFFTDTGPDQEPDGLGPDCKFSDLAPKAIGKILQDCLAFEKAADQILADCYMREGYSPGKAGQDFHYTRNGHGTGFWDREPLEADSWGDVLTGIAQDEFAEVTLYRGDDGKLYLS